MTTPTERREPDALARERDQAIAHARAVEHELGALRGEVQRLQTALWRRSVRRRRLRAIGERLRAVLHR